MIPLSGTSPGWTRAPRTVCWRPVRLSLLSRHHRTLCGMPGGTWPVRGMDYRSTGSCNWNGIGDDPVWKISPMSINSVLPKKGAGDQSLFSVNSSWNGGWAHETHFDAGATGGTIASKESGHGLSPAITLGRDFGLCPRSGGAVPGGSHPADESGQHQHWSVPLAGDGSCHPGEL